MRTRLFIFASLVACGGTENRDGPTPDPPKFEGDCPTFVRGENTISSSGEDRRFLARVPQTPDGAPVIFTWHWLGGEPDQAIDWTGLTGISATDNVWVISPFTASGSGAMWDQSAPAADNVDIRLFDDVLACLTSEHDVDLDRVWVTGHSMGALFISELVQHRAGHIAAFAPLSGGLIGDYDTPERALPGMLVWGGDSDVCCGGFDFADRTRQLSNGLRNDGSFIVHCEGDFGHQLPPMPDMVWPFLRDHVRGEPSPYADGLPANTFPDWCTIAE